MSLRDILSRHASGLPVGEKIAMYYGEEYEPLADFKKMDLTEIHAIKTANGKRMLDIKKTLQEKADKEKLDHIRKQLKEELEKEELKKGLTPAPSAGGDPQ